jgi:cytochrome c peroxidase
LRRDVIIAAMMTLSGNAARVVGITLLLALATSCTEKTAAPVRAMHSAPVEPGALARIGELAYHDRLLASSGRMSCATCHDPAFFHGPPNADPVQVGGALMTEFGFRASPSLRYLERQPAFDAHAPHGGLMADGRAGKLEAQVQLPLFSVAEFELGDARELARRLRLTVWAPVFFAHFGDRKDATLIASQLAEAISAFIREDPRFHPYDSKFDHVAAGRDAFSRAERRGLAVFRDPARGNCAGCHPDVAADGLPPLFTDFGYAAQGAPRNMKIPANADPAYFDLGLCGPHRDDLTQRAALCGMFRTPSLRNAAARPSYFHNGVFHSLAEVVDFYNTRDTHPQRWYPQVNGVVQVFNDLPEALRANVVQSAPFGPRAGNRPSMNPREAADLVCFLETLTDGHVPGTQPGRVCR